MSSTLRARRAIRRRAAGGIALALIVAVAIPALAQKPQNTVLKRITEPGDQSFSLLVPDGWKVAGAVRSASSGQALGLAALARSMQSSAASLEFAVRSDSLGTVSFRRLPDDSFCDASRLTGDDAKGISPGQQWHGMTVQPLMTAREYVSKILLPKYRANVRQLAVVEARALPDFARAQRTRLAALPTPVTATCDAAVVTVTYEEGGTSYRERFFALIEDRGVDGGGRWFGRNGIAFRAPAAEFGSWETTFTLMLASIREDADWVARQTHAAPPSANPAAAPAPSAQSSDADRKVLADRRQALDEIRAAMFPSVTSLEPFANPFTGETEIGTLALGKYRWESGAGDVIYSATETFNPSAAWTLGRSDWRKCKVEPRGSN
jgi:hypothetical protein